MGSITVLVIAHRLTTIRDADKIVVLKDGVKQEEGNHDYLIQNHPEGIYAGLVALQASANAEEPAAPEGDIDEDELDLEELAIKKKNTR
jgi:ABC-type glutathione transport system ATPase component